MVAVVAADLVVLGASAVGASGGEGALRPLHDHHALYERGPQRPLKQQRSAAAVSTAVEWVPWCAW